MLKTNILNFLKDQDESELFMESVTRYVDLHLIKSRVTDEVTLLLGSSTGDTLNMEYEGILLFDHATNSVLTAFLPNHEWMLHCVFSDFQKRETTSLDEIREKFDLALQAEFESILDNLDLDFSLMLNTTKEELQKQAQEYIDEMFIPAYDIPESKELYDRISLMNAAEILQDTSDYAYETIMKFLKKHPNFLDRYLNTAYIRQYVKDALEGKEMSDLERARMKVKELFADTESRKSFHITFKDTSGKLIRTSIKNGKDQFACYPYFAICSIEYRKNKLYEQDEKNVDTWRMDKSLWLNYFSLSGLFAKTSMKEFKPHVHGYFRWETFDSIWEMIPLELLQDFSLMAQIMQWDYLPSVFQKKGLTNDENIKDFLTELFNRPSGIHPESNLIMQTLASLTHYDTELVKQLLNHDVSRMIPEIDEETIRDPDILKLIEGWMIAHPFEKVSFIPKQMVDNPRLIQVIESVPYGEYCLSYLSDWRNGYHNGQLFADDWEKLEKLLENTVTKEKIALTVCQKMNTILEFKHVPMTLDFAIAWLNGIHGNGINEKNFSKIPRSILYNQKFLNAAFQQYMSCHYTMTIKFLEQFLKEAQKFGWNKAESVFLEHKKTHNASIFHRDDFVFDDLILVFENNPHDILFYVPRSHGDKKKVLKFLESHESRFYPTGPNMEVWNNSRYVLFNRLDTDMLVPFLEKHPVFYNWMTRNMIQNVEYLKDASKHMCILPILLKNPYLILHNHAIEDSFMKNETFLLEQEAYEEIDVLELFSTVYTYKELYAGEKGKLYTDSTFLLKLLEVNKDCLKSLQKQHPCWRDETFAKEAIKINPDLLPYFLKKVQKAIQ